MEIWKCGDASLLSFTFQLIFTVTNSCLGLIDWHQTSGMQSGYDDDIFHQGMERRRLKSFKRRVYVRQRGRWGSRSEIRWDFWQLLGNFLLKKLSQKLTKTKAKLRKKVKIKRQLKSFRKTSKWLILKRILRIMRGSKKIHFQPRQFFMEVN